MSLTSVLNIAASALRLNAAKVAASADNVANVTTDGYKAVAVEGVAVASGGRRGVGGGVTGVLRPTVSAQGLLAATTSQTDLAISGDGFFRVETPAGEHRYVRTGRFSPDAEGFLADAAGNRLLARGLDGQGRPTAGGLTPVKRAAGTAALQEDGTPGEVTGFDIASDGTVDALFANGNRRAVYQIDLAVFSNPDGLQPEPETVTCPPMLPDPPP